MCGFAAGAVAGAAPPGEVVGAVILAVARSVLVPGHGAPPGPAVCEGPRGARGGLAARGGARRAQEGGAGFGLRALCGCASGRGARAARRARGTPGRGARRPGAPSPGCPEWRLSAGAGSSRSSRPASSRLPGGPLSARTSSPPRAGTAAAGARWGGLASAVTLRSLSASRASSFGRAARALALSSPVTGPRTRRASAAKACPRGPGARSGSGAGTPQRLAGKGAHLAVQHRRPGRQKPPPHPRQAGGSKGGEQGRTRIGARKAGLQAHATAQTPLLGPPAPLPGRASRPAAPGRKQRKPQHLGQRMARRSAATRLRTPCEDGRTLFPLTPPLSRNPSGRVNRKHKRLTVHLQKRFPWDHPVSSVFAMGNAARLFTRACCHRQVVLSRPCDHGNIYCSLSCSLWARRRSLLLAGCRYQNSHRGRHKHAERQRRCRERRLRPVAEEGVVRRKCRSTL